MRLTEYLRDDFVLVSLDAPDVDTVVRAVSARAGSAGIADEALVAEKLFERERAHPTVIGSGLAIPHATVPGLPGPTIGLAVVGSPVAYGPEAENAVDVFFILLSPPGSERLHVKLLARICRLVKHGGLVERLGDATDEAEALSIVRDVDELHG